MVVGQGSSVPVSFFYPVEGRSKKYPYRALIPDVTFILEYTSSFVYTSHSITSIVVISAIGFTPLLGSQVVYLFVFPYIYMLYVTCYHGIYT